MPVNSPNADQLLHLLRTAAEEVRPELAELLDLNGAETRIWGRDSLLDSLGLVTLIAAFEREIEDAYEVTVLLADERAMSREHSPFRTAGTLADYAAELIREES